jgi:hypothetical protein
MKLEIATFDLDCIEFQDRYGIFRQSYGCSPRGVELMRAYIARLNEIIEALPEPQTASALYQLDPVFRHCCDRCLELNGIDLDWLDSQGRVLTGLLFSYQDGAGLLVRLNAIAPDDAMQPGEGKPATVHDTAAALLAATNDLKATLEALQTQPAKQINGMLKARAEHMQAALSPEEKQKADRERWAAERRAKNKSNPKPFRPDDLRRVK